MPFASKTEVMTLTGRQGLGHRGVVEDTKLLPGVHRTMFRLHGGEWVAREIVKDVQSGARNSWSIARCGLVGNQGLTITDTRTGSA